MDQCVLCEEGTEATFKFLNKGHYEDVKAFNIENVDMSNVKHIIDTIETKQKNRQKSAEEFKILQEIEELKTEIREL